MRSCRSSQPGREDRRRRLRLSRQSARGRSRHQYGGCSLALELRSQTNQAVWLADLDVNAGLVNFL